MFGFFRCVRVFREGAENCARGGRAPIPISEFGLKTAAVFHNSGLQKGAKTRPNPAL
jgi:hypothetical protein